MITFYRTEKCPRCGEVEQAIKDMCLAHEVHIINADSPLPDEVPNGTKPPFLIDEGKVIAGSSRILEHLSELEDFKKLWYKFQSDACYCDESGEVE